MYSLTKKEIDFCDAYVRKLCRKLGSFADDDAIQSGREGLVVAAKKYDPARSGSFQGFASWWIRHHLYRGRYGFSCTKKEAMKKTLVEFEDFRYSVGDCEKEICNKDMAEKLLSKATPQQRSILREMYYHDKTTHDLAREFGRTPQSYDCHVKKAIERIKTKTKHWEEKV